MRKPAFVLLTGFMILLVLIQILPVYAMREVFQMNKPRAETIEQRNARMQWWRQARFGMFVHWGLYSGLAGTWNGQTSGGSRRFGCRITDADSSRRA